MPSATPGTRNGIQKRFPKRERQVNRLTIPQSEAVPAASRIEFHDAVQPAAKAPGNSIQVRLAVTSSARGRTTERNRSNAVPRLVRQNQPGPSCCRKRADE